MNAPNDLERARLMELAVERAIGGLSGAELQDLERSLDAAGGQVPRAELDESLERATAAVHLALQPRLEPLPRELAVRIAADADRYYAEQRAVAAGGHAPGRTPREALPGWFAWGGWLAAAASCIALIGSLALDKASWPGVPADRQLTAAAPVEAADGTAESSAPAPVQMQRRIDFPAAPGGGRIRGDATVSMPAATVAEVAGTSVADPAEARAALLASQPFVLRRNWSAAGDPSGRAVTGDVVWDARTQTGYMRFVGLRRNDPTREQYQLWIFDGRRDGRFPVDGGVFDSSGEGELVVPIRAKLPVGTPLAFAVTVERAGGVVVSSRERVVVIARVS